MLVFAVSSDILLSRPDRTGCDLLRGQTLLWHFANRQDWDNPQMYFGDRYCTPGPFKSSLQPHRQSAQYAFATGK
jgi:hypothetical protein